MRGTGCHADGFRRGGRLIPAGAGNSARSAPNGTRSPAHPRGCGEQVDRPVQIFGAGGSSPRVRGTVQCGAGIRQPARLIPAGAGNRHPRADSSLPRPAHPRGCGEQSVAIKVVRPLNGSSPRVRGTVPFVEQFQNEARLIPAGAGNRSSRRWWQWSMAAHPRGCGEQARPPESPVMMSGSSPRVRGTVPRAPCLGRDGRLIPAGAGNRGGADDPPPSRPAHPRGCGEQSSGNSHRRTLDGSSPRVRGTGCSTVLE